MAPLAVAILSMLGLIAFMLLVCLLSCLYKIHKRNEKNKKLMLIAQQAGKKEGEAFRQVISCSSVYFCSSFFLKVRNVGDSELVLVQLVTQKE